MKNNIELLTQEQLEWCNEYLPEGKWSINSEGLVDVEGDVLLDGQSFQRLPVSFGKVSGVFSVDGCEQLSTLEGAPKEVGGYFNCTGCTGLRSLRGAPKKVGGYFICTRCTGLQSLEGAPLEVGDHFSCHGCTGLQSLEGAPEKVGGSFWCTECSGLQSLEGAPLEVSEQFSCWGCTGFPEWMHELSEQLRKGEITWRELLSTEETLRKRKKLGQAKNLGLF